MFFSTSVTVHLLRGLGAATLLAAAMLLAEAPLLLRLAAALGAFALMRGCPMCWAVGLFETASRRQRARRPRIPAADSPSPYVPTLERKTFMMIHEPPPGATPSALAQPPADRYQAPSDLQLARSLAALAPAEAKAFLAFDHAAKRDSGRITPQVREWIALSVALTTHCGYCLDVHTRAARVLGTTREELAEIVLIAAAVRAGATVGHGLLALRLFDSTEQTA